MWGEISVLPCNRCCIGKTTMRFLFIVGLRVTVNIIKHWVLRSIVLQRIYVTENSKTHLSLHVKCQIFLSDFNQIWIMSADFYKLPEIKKSNFMEICPVGLALIRADRRTDMTKVTRNLSGYANCPKISISCLRLILLFSMVFRINNDC